MFVFLSSFLFSFLCLFFLYIKLILSHCIFVKKSILSNEFAESKAPQPWLQTYQLSCSCDGSNKKKQQQQKQKTKQATEPKEEQNEISARC